MVYIFIIDKSKVGNYTAGEIDPLLLFSGRTAGNLLWILYNI